MPQGITYKFVSINVIRYILTLHGVDLLVFSLSPNAGPSSGNIDETMLQPIQRKKLRRQFVLSEVEERILMQILEKVSEWGFPLEAGKVRSVVRDYLNATSHIVFPIIQDRSTGQISDFVAPLKLISRRRDIYTFEKLEFNVL